MVTFVSQFLPKVRINSSWSDKDRARAHGQSLGNPEPRDFSQRKPNQTPLHVASTGLVHNPKISPIMRNAVVLRFSCARACLITSAR